MHITFLYTSFIILQSNLSGYTFLIFLSCLLLRWLDSPFSSFQLVFFLLWLTDLIILIIPACLSCYFVDCFLYFRHFSLSFPCFGWLFWWFWGFQLAFFLPRLTVLMILRISACLSCYFVDFFLYFRHFSLSFSCFGWLFWWFWGFQLAFPAQLVDFFFYFRHFSLPSLPTSVTSILVSFFQSFYQLSPWQYSIPDKKIQKNSLSSLQKDTKELSHHSK